MAYPVSAVSIPASLGGQTNGKLPDTQLVVVGFPGRTNARLHRQAYRAWSAFYVELQRRFGLILTVTSNADAYRSYVVQEATFRSRYTTEVLAGRPWKTWNGVRWYQKPGTAMAAVPGTSNHGWGLAVDACWWVNGTTVGITAQPAAFAWMLSHAAGYGFSWEAQSEPWHLRYFAGDNTPQAVLDYENPTPPPTIPLEDDDMVLLITCNDGVDTEVWVTNGPVKSWVPDADALAAIQFTLGAAGTVRKLSPSQFRGYGVSTVTYPGRDAWGVRITG